MRGAAFGRLNSDASAKALAGKGKNAVGQLIEKQLTARPGAGRPASDPHPLPSRPRLARRRDAGGGGRPPFVCAPLCDPRTRNLSAEGRGVGE